jgi:hypothetical protein
VTPSADICGFCGLPTESCKCTRETVELAKLWAAHNEQEAHLDHVRAMARVVAAFYSQLVIDAVPEDSAENLTAMFMEQIAEGQIVTESDDDADSDADEESE